MLFAKAPGAWGLSRRARDSNDEGRYLHRATLGGNVYEVGLRMDDAYMPFSAFAASQVRVATAHAFHCRGVGWAEAVVMRGHAHAHGVRRSCEVHTR
jgi:hypothetical protein